MLQIFDFLRGLVLSCVFPSFPVSNTRFIAAVIERHTHTPERRRRYWGRSGTESDHGKKNCGETEFTEKKPTHVVTLKPLQHVIQYIRIDGKRIS